VISVSRRKAREEILSNEPSGLKISVEGGEWRFFILNLKELVSSVYQARITLARYPPGLIS
jgi:hypothetical protein